MNYKVNFQKAKRNYMVLTFTDEREEKGKIVEFEKTIQVGMPKKRIFTALINMQEVVDRLNEAETEAEKNEVNKEIIEEMYELTAQILSNNLEGENITAEWVDKQLSINEIREFFQEYIKFTRGEATNPN